MLQVGCTTYAYLYQMSFEDSIRSLANSGYKIIEIAAAQPHVSMLGTGVFERLQIAGLIESLDMRCVSVNPAELNLISPNRSLRDASLAEYVETIDFAHDIGAEHVMVVPGRRNALSPAPMDLSLALLEKQLAVLVKHARHKRVQISLETSPYGFLGTGKETADVVRKIGDEYLGVGFDCANVIANEDIADGVREVGELLTLAHLSDTWRDRFAHTSIGRGEVDFVAFHDSLVEIGYTGHTIYELVDGEDPSPRAAHDIAELKRFGWILDDPAEAVPV